MQILAHALFLLVVGTFQIAYHILTPKDAEIHQAPAQQPEHIETQNTPAEVSCDYCGGQKQSSATRCGGCGAS